MKSFRLNKSWRGRTGGTRVAIAAAVVAAAAGTAVAVPAASARTAAKKSSSAPLVVWYDASRAAYVSKYKATHPHQNIKWVLYSGDSNGDGTLQSKFALYNRVGWKPGVAPDVVFDEENYEAGWLGLQPFNDLLDLSKYIPKKVWSQDEGLGDCLINGKLLLYRQMLTDKPLTIDFNAFPSIEYELVMYANNLGSIPPNTALMMVTAGDQKFEVYLSSSEQQSAAVKFIYRSK